MLVSSSLLLTAPRTLQWTQEVLPDPGPEDVAIQTTSGAISSGSEIPQYLGTNRSVAAASYPRMTGYESVGRVVKCGSAVQDIRVGDRAIAFYGHRTHAVVPAASIVSVPDDISDALALLAILSCDVARGVRKLTPLPEQPIAISGAGAIGLLTVFMLTALGCYQVDVLGGAAPASGVRDSRFAPTYCGDVGVMRGSVSVAL
jgi:alcohol dehydrogenase